MFYWRSAFQDHIFARGFEYYEDGAVCKSKKTKYGYKFKIQGTKRYTIKIKLRKLEIINMTCSCPHYESGHFCKHLVAALLCLEDILVEKMGFKKYHRKGCLHFGKHSDYEPQQLILEDEFLDSIPDDDFDGLPDDSFDMLPNESLDLPFEKKFMPKILGLEIDLDGPHQIVVQDKNRLSQAEYNRLEKLFSNISKDECIAILLELLKKHKTLAEPFLQMEDDWKKLLGVSRSRHSSFS